MNGYQWVYVLHGLRRPLQWVSMWCYNNPSDPLVRWTSMEVTAKLQVSFSSMGGAHSQWLNGKLCRSCLWWNEANDTVQWRLIRIFKEPYALNGWHSLWRNWAFKLPAGTYSYMFLQVISTVTSHSHSTRKILPCYFSIHETSAGNSIRFKSSSHEACCRVISELDV